MTPAELAPSLGPLVLLLSSDKIGEVAAAAAQITGRPRKSGLTELRRPSGAATCWADVAEFLAAHADPMAPRDRQFIASMRDLIARGFTPTHKQAAWLRGLFARAGGGWAEEAA